MINAQYDYGEAVRVIRSVRNDGTFPGRATGDLLVRRGRIGYVQDVGTFLQDQIVYSVHFLDINRIVGCREHELISADAPWVDSAYDVRDKVATRKTLSIGGEPVVALGDVGEVMQVCRDAPEEVAYHVVFGELMLAVPESALAPHALKEDGGP